VVKPGEDESELAPEAPPSDPEASSDEGDPAPKVVLQGCDPDPSGRPIDLVARDAGIEPHEFRRLPKGDPRAKTSLAIDKTDFAAQLAAAERRQKAGGCSVVRWVLVLVVLGLVGLAAWRIKLFLEGRTSPGSLVLCGPL
jgi:hypothetical protein